MPASKKRKGAKKYVHINEKRRRARQGEETKKKNLEITKNRRDKAMKQSQGYVG